MIAPTTNRRRHERFATLPMYTGVEVKIAGADRALAGHAYDIAEGGAQFELDEALPPGTPVTLRVNLPRWLPRSLSPDAITLDDGPPSVEVMGRIVWTDNDGVPGPVRMAAAFTSFADAADRHRLIDTLAAGLLRRAA